jgi:hypothetical protein
MKRRSMTVVVLACLAFVAAGTTSAAATPTRAAPAGPATAQVVKASTITHELPEDAFVHHYVRSGLSCPDDQVMVGVHIVKREVICAGLNHGYRVANRDTDPVRGNDVSDNPSMHGCLPDYFIQGLVKHGRDEELRCVSLEDPAGEALVQSDWRHDGRGPDNDGTQSTDEYGPDFTPRMHVCPRPYAMQGIHQAQNDLYCAV